MLVMCHTRELAFQISKEYERFSKYMPTVKVQPVGGIVTIGLSHMVQWATAVMIMQMID